jgi:hypothetical protein
VVRGAAIEFSSYFQRPASADLIRREKTGLALADCTDSRRALRAAVQQINSM